MPIFDLSCSIYTKLQLTVDPKFPGLTQSSIMTVVERNSRDSSHVQQLLVRIIRKRLDQC